MQCYGIPDSWIFLKSWIIHNHTKRIELVTPLWFEPTATVTLAIWPPSMAGLSLMNMLRLVLIESHGEARSIAGEIRGKHTSVPWNYALETVACAQFQKFFFKYSISRESRVVLAGKAETDRLHSSSEVQQKQTCEGLEIACLDWTLGPRRHQLIFRCRNFTQVGLAKMRHPGYLFTSRVRISFM